MEKRKDKKYLLCFASIFFVLMIVLLALIIFGFFKFAQTPIISDVDVISFQISILGIIIATIAIGGGLLAFLGWKEIKEDAGRIAKQELSNYIKKDIIKEIVQANLTPKCIIAGKKNNGKN